MTTAKGITEKNRQLLEVLHRHARGPFGVADAAAILKLPPPRTKRLLAYFATSGWLSRIRRDAYTTVPLGATSPSEWRADPWVVAAATFAPCYIGGWTACEHWGLTEQLFRDIVVMTARRVRHRLQQIQGTRFRLKVVPERRLFGTRTVWREQNAVTVSDPARTVVDLLDDPSVGGGMRHVGDIVRASFNKGGRQDERLLEYATRLGNRTVFKRLGYLVEILGIEAADVLAGCTARMSAGVSLLDPSAQARGPIIKRWNLRANVNVPGSAEK